MRADDSIKTLKGVGEAKAALLEKLGIVTVADLFRFYPRKYEIYELPVQIGSLREGAIAAIETAVTARPEVVRIRGRVIVSIKAVDATGEIRLTWFNAPFIAKQLRAGSRFIFRGRVVRSRGRLMLSQPAIFTRESYIRMLSSLQPVYRLTAGITNSFISGLIKKNPEYLGVFEDYLPAKARKEMGLTAVRDALETIHFPVSTEALQRARERLVFDEFTGFMLGVRRMREERVREVNTCRVYRFTECEELISSLPYTLTSAQQRVWEEVKNDLSGPFLMSRMIEGDVGSGKTVVAVLAMLACVCSGYQACIMVPTEVLAKQHYETVCGMLARFGVRVQLLTGQLGAAAKREAYEKIRSHETDIVVGTHALIQSGVEFDSLALAIIDEQHRFGVRQRELLRSKGESMHILAMSATPIPRSLAIILYGDLDLSLLDGMPAERLPVKNCVVTRDYRPTARNFIKKQIELGHQAYIICPLVEDEDGESEAENVADYRQELEEYYSDAGIRIEALHGKMKSVEKAAVMERFEQGITQILVSTTVIEVGVNVVNATVMLVENAERFGLAQLHQLRGRVGRGSDQSYCIFIKGNDSPETDERLGVLVNTNDGFKVAEQDLKMRGPGDIFGVRQSGELVFSLGDVYADAATLKKATDYVNGLSSEELEVLYGSELFAETTEYNSP